MSIGLKLQWYGGNFVMFCYKNICSFLVLSKYKKIIWNNTNVLIIIHNIKNNINALCLPLKEVSVGYTRWKHQKYLTTL